MAFASKLYLLVTGFGCWCLVQAMESWDQLGSSGFQQSHHSQSSQGSRRHSVHLPIQMEYKSQKGLLSLPMIHSFSQLTKESWPT